MVTEKKKHGRKDKMNDEVITQIMLALKAGAYIETATRFAGIADRHSIIGCSVAGRKSKGCGIHHVQKIERVKRNTSVFFTW